MIRALIFDFDGTIVDTETLWFEVCRGQFSEQGFELPLATYARCVGASLAAYSPYGDLAARLGRPEQEAAFEADAFRRYGELEEGLGPRAGVVSLIEAAVAAGQKLAVASSSNRSHVERYLVDFGLIGHFDAVLTREDVTQVKPAPDLYLSALARLGVSASEALVFEDSPNGLAAAEAAGIRCVVITNPLTASLTFGTGAIHRTESFAELSLSQVLAW